MEECQPDHIEYCSFHGSLYDTLDPGHNAIAQSNVYIMMYTRPVEDVGFYIWEIGNDTRDWPCPDGPEPLLCDHYRLMVASSFGILVLSIFLLEHH